MGAIKDLWQSERGLVAILLIVACTVLCAMTRLTIDQWLDYTKWIFITYAAAKTVTGTAKIAADSAKSPSPSSSLLDGVLTAFLHKANDSTSPQPNNPPPPDPVPAPATTTTH